MKYRMGELYELCGIDSLYRATIDYQQHSATSADRLRHQLNRFRIASTAALKASGFSMLLRCPAPGIWTSSLFGIAPAISDATAGGVTASCSPTTTNVGTWIADRPGVASGRSRSA